MNSVQYLNTTVSKSNIVAAVAAQLQAFGKIKEMDVEDMHFGDFKGEQVPITIFFKEVETKEGNGKD